MMSLGLGNLEKEIGGSEEHHESILQSDQSVRSNTYQPKKNQRTLKRIAEQEKIDNINDWKKDVVSYIFGDTEELTQPVPDNSLGLSIEQVETIKEQTPKGLQYVQSFDGNSVVEFANNLLMEDAIDQNIDVLYDYLLTLYQHIVKYPPEFLKKIKIVFCDQIIIDQKPASGYSNGSKELYISLQSFENTSDNNIEFAFDHELAHCLDQGSYDHLYQNTDYSDQPIWLINPNYRTIGSHDFFLNPQNDPELSFETDDPDQQLPFCFPNGYALTNEREFLATIMGDILMDPEDFGALLGGEAMPHYGRPGGFDISLLLDDNNQLTTPIPETKTRSISGNEEQSIEIEVAMCPGLKRKLDSWNENKLKQNYETLRGSVPEGKDEERFRAHLYEAYLQYYQLLLMLQSAMQCVIKAKNKSNDGNWEREFVHMASSSGGGNRWGKWLGKGVEDDKRAARFSAIANGTLDQFDWE